MKKKLLPRLLYSLVLVMASSELMANDLSISSDIKNWTPYIDGTISLDAFARSVQGNSLNSTAPAIYLSLDDRQPGLTASPGPNNMQVVPAIAEPGALLLLGIGMIGLASFGRRKFKK